MKIFDCFTYYNESNLLEMRFNELDSLVSNFIIIEASETFSGKDKPFYFDDVEKLFDKWSHKIVRHKIDFPSKKMSSWEREFFQRNYISKAVKELSESHEDIVIISDADEIPSKKAILNLNTKILPVQLDVTQFFWNLHWEVPDHCNQGARPVLCFVDQLKENTPQELRAMALARVENGGWHFSFYGMEEKAKEKIESFAHTEYDLEDYKDLEKILFRIENGIDPFDRFPLKYKEIDNSYPSFIKKKQIVL